MTAKNRRCQQIQNLSLCSFILERYLARRNVETSVDTGCPPVSLAAGIRLLPGRRSVQRTPNFFLLAYRIHLGDFEEIYGAQEGDGSGQEPQSGQWDAILTCFFIDTVSTTFLLHRKYARLNRTTGKEYCELPSHYSPHIGTRRRMDQPR